MLYKVRHFLSEIYKFEAADRGQQQYNSMLSIINIQTELLVTNLTKLNGPCLRFLNFGTKFYNTPHSSHIQVYRDPGFTIVQHGKELHSWQVLLNGVLEVKEEGLPPKLLHVGESFGMPAATQVYNFYNSGFITFIARVL